MSGRAWTPEEDRIIRDAFLRGIAYADILPQLPGRSKSSVGNRACLLRAEGALPQRPLGRPPRQCDREPLHDPLPRVPTIEASAMLLVAMLRYGARDGRGLPGLSWPAFVARCAEHNVRVPS